MPARKIAISLSEEALEAVDSGAQAEGISRSAWFERAVERARRKDAMRLALRQAAQAGVKRSSGAQLEALRRELAGQR